MTAARRPTRPDEEPYGIVISLPSQGAVRPGLAAVIHAAEPVWHRERPGLPCSVCRGRMTEESPVSRGRVLEATDEAESVSLFPSDLVEDGVRVTGATSEEPSGP